MASTYDHPHSGAGPREDSDLDPDDSDTRSVLCDDSLLPNIERRDKPPQTLYEACAANDAVSLRSILEKGVSKDQAMHVDINGRSGLMVAVSKGFVDVVSTLHVCPLIDVNHQDNDGNSALMIAAQAGFTTILNFILNHYSGVDTELRDPRGFTALMKAGLQGREECVSALLMHGADMNARDHVQAGALKDWVLKTGRFETLSRIRRLQARPVAEQFCERYAPEWPQLRELVAKATGSKSTSRKLRQIIKKNLTFSFPHDPQNNGVMDHMVRMTTGIRSPLVATACHPLCPSSPPQIGKRRFALPERLEEHSSAKLEEHAVSHSKGPLASAASVQLSSRCQEAERGESAPPGAVRSFIPRSVARRNSIFPTRCVPKIEVTKSGEPTPKTEKKNQQNGYLELPVWRYKEKKKREKQKEMEQEKISENIDKT